MPTKKIKLKPKATVLEQLDYIGDRLRNVENQLQEVRRTMWEISGLTEEQVEQLELEKKQNLE